MARQAQQDLMSRVVEVRRVHLIDMLKENKEKHVKEYHEAIVGYKEAALEKLVEDADLAFKNLKKSVEDVRREIDEFDPENPGRFDDHFVLIPQATMFLPVPRCYANEYDAAIAVAEWEVSDTMKLQFSEFQAFVRNRWEWTHDFEVTTSRYTGKKKKI